MWSYSNNVHCRWMAVHMLEPSLFAPRSDSPVDAAEISCWKRLANGRCFTRCRHCGALGRGITIMRALSLYLHLSRLGKAGFRRWVTMRRLVVRDRRES
jgi:hypothetical protein